MIVVLAAVLVGVSVGAVVFGVVRPPTPLRSRLGPELAIARARSGAASSGSVVGQLNRRGSSAVIFGWARSLFDLVDPAPDDELRLRMRRAGAPSPSAANYREHQARWAAIGGVILAALIGLLGVRSIVVLVIVGFFGALLGAMQYKSKLAERAEKRAERIKVETYSTAQVIAGVSEAGLPPVAACRHICQRHHGVVSDELRTVLGWIERGTPTGRAFETLARETNEPSFARLLRMIANAASAGGDLASQLRALAIDQRRERREYLKQAAEKRKAALLLPSIIFLVPVLLLYVALPMPFILFGGG